MEVLMYKNLAALLVAASLIGGTVTAQADPGTLTKIKTAKS